MTFPFPENHDKACCKFIGKARYYDDVYGVFKCIFNPGGIFYGNETYAYAWIWLNEIYKDHIYDGSLDPETFRFNVTLFDLFERTSQKDNL
jgi:hypothetical protein